MQRINLPETAYLAVHDHDLPVPGLGRVGVEEKAELCGMLVELEEAAAALASPGPEEAADTADEDTIDALSPITVAADGLD